MKNLSKLLMAGLIAIGLTACGAAQTPVATTYGQQIVGYNPNGTPIYGAAGGTACFTMGQPLTLGFSAQGIDVVQARFFAGNIPQFGTAAGAHGQLTLGGGFQQTPGSISLTKNSMTGSTINMTLNPQARTASGNIQISAADLMNPNLGLINSMYYNSYNTGYNTGYNNGAVNSQMCVTSVAMDVVYVASYYGGYSQQMTTG